MTDKTEGPAKDPGRAGEGSGVKRPHATLDLKATEIPDPAASSSAASSSASAASGAAENKSADAKSDAASSAPPDKPAEAEAAAKPGATAKPQGAAPMSPPPPTPPPPPRASSGGFSRFLSLLAAGAIGGGLVYAGSALLGPDSGFFNVGDTEAAKQLEARLAALEARQGDTATTIDLAAKLGDTDGRLAKLEGVRNEIAALNETQGKLANDTKALSDKVAATDTGPQDAERIGKLEERLDVMAAGAPGPDGRLPQLAAISGKIADLEAALNTQVASLRKAIPADFDGRLQASAEAAEAARSGTQRVDRELAQVRTDLARVTQRQEVSKADTDRLAASLQSAQEQVGKLESTIGDLKGSLEGQIKGTAKPADVSAAVAPVASKLAALEQNLAGVVKSDDDRKANAERIVLSLELANLKRALDRGQGYAAELAEVRKASNGKLDLLPLERFKETGVPALATLQTEFQPLIDQVIDADTEPADGSIIDRLVSGARSIVRVRKVGHDVGDNSAEAIIGRMERAVDDGQLGIVIEQAKLLPPRAAQPMQEWLQKVNARNSVDSAMSNIESQLKSSLSGSAADQGARPAGKEVN
jgi:hypothetical protein